MNLAVCVQSQETRDLLARLFERYREQVGVPLHAQFFQNETGFVCDFLSGEYDAIFFDGAYRSRFTEELREKDQRVRLVRLVPVGAAATLEAHIWYCLVEPPSPAFLFPILDQLRSDASKEREAGLFIKAKGSVMHLNTSSIEYVEVVGRTVFFHLATGSIEEVVGSFTDIETRLLHWPDFVKVHRSYLVNLRYVQKLEPGSILTFGGHSIPVSRHLYAQFKKDYLCHMMEPEAKAELPLVHTTPNTPPPDGWRVLLVDDEQVQRQHWSGVLELHGCTVKTASDGDSALALSGSEQFDCVVLDVKLGSQCGFDLCALLAERTGAPVIFLSSLDDSQSQAQGFLCGGNDYITKDAPDELFWLKIEARIKMAQAGKTDLSDGGLRLNLKGRKAFLLGQDAQLTAVEFELLSLLMQNPGTVLAPARFYEVIWGVEGDSHGVQMHLSQLQRKLQHVCPWHSFIETVWGKGYRFCSMPAEQGGGA